MQSVLFRLLFFVAGASHWIPASANHHNRGNEIALERFTSPGQVFVNGELQVTQVTPLADDDSYLDDRTTYYAEVVQNLASAYYADDLFTTCTYYDQCRNFQSVSNESLVNFPDVGIAVNESITATKLLDGKTTMPMNH